MTPLEVWTKKQPTVAHLRVFGCDAYAHVPKDERGKLDSKAKKCILVGYGEETKGYRLYDPIHAKIFFSRDVVFNERKCGTEREATESEEDQYVELDLASGDDAPAESAPAEPVVRRSERGILQTTLDGRQTLLQVNWRSQLPWRK